MNNTKKVKPAPAVTPPVTFSQVIALAIEMAQAKIADLLKIYTEDDDLGSEESDADYALRVGLERIERMRAIEFSDYGSFDAQWFGVAAILKLAWKSLTQRDTWYSRCLQNACDFFEQMRNSVEFVQLQERRGAT